MDVATSGAWLGAAPTAWLALTVLAYLFTWEIYRRAGNSPFLLPALTGSALIVAALLLTGTDYADYYQHTRPIHFLIGPAIVLLAVPLYGQLKRLRSVWLPVTVALLAGSVTAIASAILIGWSLGATWQTLWSLAPKSSTMPIGMAVSEQTGGLAALTALATAITGISGAIASPWVMRWLAPPAQAAEDDEAAKQREMTEGFALGLVAHAIGTARALQTSETAGAFAALAMILNGIATALFILVGLAWL